MKIAIIGGGPSALFCALNINKDYSVTIFCKEEKLGKKILVTGNGRCNLSNALIYNDSYNVDITEYLSKLNQDQTLKMFESFGLETYCDSEGRVYPISNSATSVVEVLNREIDKRKNIIIKLNEEVFDIKRNKNKFIINENYEYDKVVICTGSSNKLLDLLNIKYQKFVPSLMALKTKENTNRLSGLKLSNVKVKLEINNISKTEHGEVLFKDKGLSGICIFNLSAILSRLNNFNATILIDLLPNYSEKQLKTLFFKRKILNVSNISEFLQGLFHKEINKYILKTLNINEDLQVENISDKIIDNLIDCIKNLKFTINSYYENNQVKCGGVKLIDLDKNLQSKHIPNLYFAGEVCNVDGLCGGYNLQWAWTSGYIVGANI